MSVQPRLQDRQVLYASEAAELFDANRAALQRYLLSTGLAVADCEEVVQETFLALFQHLSQEKPRDNLRGWIFRVGHNLALKLLIRGGRNAELLDLHADPLPDPEQRAVQRQRQRRLLAVVRAMPQQDRECLSLRAEGFRYREIADILGISLGSVANCMARALDKLTSVDGRL
jgi:RNA polymerase sigma-70 factor (ECF subfamily)